MKPTQQSTLLKKFKVKSETSVPSLGLALRRAAAFGTPDDIEQLLALGAPIDETSPKSGNTALHLSVQHTKVKNTEYLLERHANIKLVNAEKQTPGDIAAKSDNEQIREFFDEKAHPVLKMDDTLFIILSKLPLDSLYQNMRVSSQWLILAQKVIKHRLVKLGLEQTKITKFFELPKPLQRSILSAIYDQPKEDQKDLINTLMNALALKDEARAAVFDLHLAHVHPARQIKTLSYANLSALVLNCATVDQIYRWQSRSDKPYIASMLLEGMINAADLNVMRHSGSTQGPFDNLATLNCYYGYKAIKLGLLTVNDAAHIHNLTCLLSKNGLTALEKKWLTVAQASHFYHSGSCHGPHDNLRELLSDGGLKLLEDEIITADQAPYINCLQELTQNEAIEAVKTHKISFKGYPGDKIRSQNKFISLLLAAKDLLDKKLLTVPQLRQIAESKNNIDFNRHSHNLVSALQSGLLKIEELDDLKSTAILTDRGYEALKEGLVTIEQAKQYTLKIINTPEGVAALRADAITVEEAENFKDHSQSFSVFISPVGQKAKNEGLINAQQAAMFYHSGSATGNHDNLQHLLTPTGLAALRENLITPETACQIISLSTLFGGDYNPDLILAMKRGLIKSDDFKYPGKYTPWGGFYGDFRKAVHELIAQQDLLDKPQHEHEPACITIQRYWRGYKDRVRVGLFREINTRLKSATFHDLAALNKAKNATDAYRLSEAKELLSARKPEVK